MFYYYLYTRVKLIIKIKVMKNYLVLSIVDIDDSFEVNDLDELIKDMYSQELASNSFETVKKWFFNNYNVYESESEIKLLKLEDS